MKLKNQSSKLYNKNIKAIKDILSGKKESLIKKLKKELNQLSKNQKFEKAIELRNKIGKLKRVFENAKIINAPGFMFHVSERKESVLAELKRIFKLGQFLRRIEGYDISNIQGKNAVGAMVVFTNGEPDKNEYRKFKIRLKQTPDDIAMLKEVLFRRFNHPEWPFPDLILIDGGIAQLNAAKGAIAKFPSFAPPAPSASEGPGKASEDTAIISLAKGKNEVFSSTLQKPIPMKKLPNKIKNLILNIDSEAHRFAIVFYRKLHRKKLIEKFTP